MNPGARPGRPCRVLLRSVNYPDRYLRHCNNALLLNANDGTSTCAADAATDRDTNTWDNPSAWTDEVSWVVTSPWAWRGRH